MYLEVLREGARSSLVEIDTYMRTLQKGGGGLLELTKRYTGYIHWVEIVVKMWVLK